MRMDLLILGKVVGTYESWDQVYEHCIIWYQFELREVGLRWLPMLPPELGNQFDISVNFTEGTVVAYDELSNEFQLKPSWAVFDEVN